MAQILKLQNGGSTKKYGTFTIDGNKYQVDDDFINQLTEYGKTLSPKVGNQFNNIINAVKSGEDISFDSVGFGRLHGNVNFNVTDKQQQRLQDARTDVGSFLGELWGGKEQSARKAITALKDFKYSKPESPRYKYDWSNKINVEYQRGKDGNYILNDGKKVFIQGANNLRAIDRLKSLAEVGGYSNNDEFIGYNNLDKNAYINLHQHLGEQGINDLINRIQSGTWTEQDKLALDDIGIFLDEAPENTNSYPQSSETQQIENQVRDNYKKAGIDYNYKNVFGVADDGSITIIDPTLQSYIGDNDAWLNDEFKRRYGAYASYIPDGSGLFVINGKVYKGDNTEQLSKIQKYLDFIAENRKTAGNSQLIKQYWDDNRSRSPWYSTTIDINGNTKWSPYFQPNKYVADRTGEYIRQEGDPLVYDYFPNYDPNDLSQFDAYGHPLRSLAQRVYIDPISKQRVNFTGELQEQIDPNLINSYYENTTQSAFNPYYTIGSKGGYKEVANVGDIKNANTKAALYFHPETKEYYFYDENPGNDNLIINSKLPTGSDRMRDYYWNIDPRLGQYIQNNPQVLRDSDVKKLIAETIQNPYLANITTRRQTDFSSIMIKYPELYKLLIDLYKSQSLKNGNNRMTVSGSGGNTELRNITSPEELESRGLAYRVYKEGGIIKHQIGGVASNRGNASKVSSQGVQQSNKKLRSAGEDKIIGDGTELNSADKAELTALIADAASLGMTFVPAWGNIAGAGIGAIGSLAGFNADIKRDGLDWGDVGNLALNLGLDTATLIPGIGTGAKATKIAKALKNSKALAKAVKYASSAVSLGTAADGIKTAWSNIQDGTWTIKDIRTVLNGVRGFANIQRTKGSSKSKTTTGETVTLKANSGSLPDIKLNKSELEEIQQASKNMRLDKLEELLISKLPKNTKTDQVTDLLSEYGIKKSGNIEWNWRKPLNIKKNSTINTKQFNFDKIEGNYLDPKNLNWWNWNRRAAIRDMKSNPNNPYFRPRHWDTGELGDFMLPNPITRPIYSNFAPDLGVFSITPEIRKEYDFTKNRIFYKKGGKVIKAQGGAGTRDWDIKGWLKKNIKPDMLLSGTDLITSTRGINKTSNKMKSAIKTGMIGSQQSTPEEFYPQYSDNGINRLYNERIKDIRATKSVTSDPNRALAENLARDSMVDKINAERNMALTQGISEYKNKMLGLKQQYANQRMQIANENKNRWYTGLAQLDMAEANRIGQQIQNKKGFLYQLRQDYARDLNEALAAKERLSLINASTEYRNKLNELFKSKGGFSIMTPEETKLFGNDWERFAAYKWPNEVNDISNKYNFKAIKDTVNDPLKKRSFFNFLFGTNIDIEPIKTVIENKRPDFIPVLRKQGGRIKRFRNIDEQLFLDQQKAANNAVRDLNNNIIRLFTKMMS